MTRLNRRSRNTKCRHENKGKGVSLKKTQNRSGISFSLLGLLPVPLHKDASHKQLVASVADVSLQLIPTDVDLSISLASSQNSCNVKTWFPFPSAPHPIADIVSFITWLVCRKRTTVLDPKRMHMQALDDCARYCRVTCLSPIVLLCRSNVSLLAGFVRCPQCCAWF